MILELGILGLSSLALKHLKELFRNRSFVLKRLASPLCEGFGGFTLLDFESELVSH